LGGIGIDWSVAYGDLLTFADIVEALIGEIRTQAHAFMDAGNQVVDHDGNTAYKLVPKRATPFFTDADSAIREAQKLAAVSKKKLDVNAFFNPPAVKSPAQFRAVVAEALMDGTTKKAREEAAKEWMKPYVDAISSGTTIAPADDRRAPAAPPAEYALALAQKLAALSGQ
ncbi:MAG: hypothetical protein WAT79_04920, partial [Saprospiraceae bacterium]